MGTSSTIKKPRARVSENAISPADVAPITTPTIRNDSGKVVHLFWAQAGEVAQVLGVDFPAVCGVWTSAPSTFHLIEPEWDASGQATMRPLVKDCGNCVRIVKATYRKTRVQ